MAPVEFACHKGGAGNADPGIVEQARQALAKCLLLIHQAHE